MAPDVMKVGKPVMIGGTDPNLTHMGNQWLFRCRPNDSYSGAVIADYGVKALGKKKWAKYEQPFEQMGKSLKRLDVKEDGGAPALAEGASYRDKRRAELTAERRNASPRSRALLLPELSGLRVRAVHP